jgi:putative spermidine/putrescine transport system permease protein
VIADNVGTAGNIPFAAAMSILPISVVLLYLFGVKRFGALENL